MAKKEWWAQFVDDVADSVKHKGTRVYRVLFKDADLRKFADVKRVMDKVGSGVVVWQHNRLFHASAILLEPNSERNDHYPYSRDVLNLVASGITGEDIRQIPKEDIGNLDLPKAGLDVVGTARGKLQELVVVDTENNIKGIIQEQKVLKGRNTGTDKTHLITAQMAGIEAHAGVLVDYSATLNEGPMNDFEAGVMRYLETRRGVSGRRILWTSYVWRDEDGMHLQHRPYLQNKITHEWERIERVVTGKGGRIKSGWLDSWNNYIWYDDGIDKLD